jgi:signal transduction histidine kinase
MRPAAAEKGVEIRAALGEAREQVLADADRLQQVVSNLLSNAVKFTPRGGRVDVRVRRDESRLWIEVTDTGEGIEPSFLPHVFDRMRQGDGTSTRSQGGLGLGLAIVRHLVTLHGGRVQAESAGKGMGATFRVGLSLLPSAVTSPT